MAKRGKATAERGQIRGSARRGGQGELGVGRSDVAGSAAEVDDVGGRALPARTPSYLVRVRLAADEDADGDVDDDDDDDDDDQMTRLTPT